MVKHSASSLLVSKSHYVNSPEYLSKLIRGILYGLKITNRQFHERYHVAFPPEPGTPARNSNSRISALCGDIYNNEKFMTAYIFRQILTVIGYTDEVLRITVAVEGRDEPYVFATDMTCQDIDDMCQGGDKKCMISADKYNSSPGKLSKLLRGILYGLRISREDFKALYKEKYEALDRAEQRSGSARLTSFNFNINNDKKSITFYLFEGVLRVLKVRILSMGADVKDVVTHDIKTFSTAMSADDIDEMIKKTDAIGISAL